MLPYFLFICFGGSAVARKSEGGKPNWSMVSFDAAQDGSKDGERSRTTALVMVWESRSLLG